MRISCSRSEALTSTLLLAGAVLLMGAGGLGCHSSTSDGSCSDDVAPDEAGHLASAMHRGRVSIEDDLDYDGKGGSTPSNFITASFTDISEVEVTSREPYPIIYNCFGLTGVPTTSCRAGKTAPCVVESLDATSVAVEGMAAGTVSLTRASTGKFSKLDSAAPFFGTGDVTARVTGKSQTGYIPSYDQTVKTPDPLTLVTPSPAAETETHGDLRIEWEKGNGNYMLIDVQADGTSDKIQCIAVDDGCQVITETLLDIFVGSKGVTGTAKRFKISISRILSTQSSIDSNTSVLFSATTKVTSYATR
jgi:hypothetical protein